jgi:hypothetical protein
LRRVFYFQWYLFVMNILITEDQYEKLLKASIKRHAKDPEPNIKGGMFNVGGHLVKYSIVNRGGKSIYVNYSYDDLKRMVYIMTDENFIQLNKKEQEDAVEFRIKKDIEKKSKLDVLTESAAMNWVKRRANKESMKEYITDGEINYPTLCDDFGDEFEFADNVINYAVDKFMTIDEDMFLEDKFDEVNEIITDMCKQWFGEYLFDIYRTTCSEENDY